MSDDEPTVEHADAVLILAELGHIDYHVGQLRQVIRRSGIAGIPGVEQLLREIDFAVRSLREPLEP